MSQGGNTGVLMVRRCVLWFLHLDVKIWSVVESPAEHRAHTHNSIVAVALVVLAVTRASILLCYTSISKLTSSSTHTQGPFRRYKRSCRT